MFFKKICIFIYLYMRWWTTSSRYMPTMSPFCPKSSNVFSRTRPTKVFLLPSHLYQLLFRPSSFLSYEGDPGTTHQGWREGGERIAADLEGGGKLIAGLEETEVSPCLEEGGQGVAAFLEETWYLGGWAPHVQSLQCPAWPQRS